MLAEMARLGRKYKLRITVVFLLVTLVKWLNPLCGTAFMSGERIHWWNRIRQNRTPEIKNWRSRRDIPHVAFVMCADRLEEAFTLLKSAVMFTRSELTLHVFTQPDKQGMVQTQLTSLPQSIKARVEFNFYNVSFPTDVVDYNGTLFKWEELYAPCAAQRLFLSSILTDVDSVLYVDIDILFLAPIEEIWAYFNKFNSTQFMAAASCVENSSESIYVRYKNVPFYKPAGLNTGVLLLNLTRLRSSTWLQSMKEIAVEYREKFRWGEQDIVNVFMAYHPENAFLLPCQWNYRMHACPLDSLCKEAEIYGAAILHGIGYTFINKRKKIPVLTNVFTAFNQFNLSGQQSIESMVEDLKIRLQRLRKTQCGRNPKVYTARMEKFINNSTPTQ